MKPTDNILSALGQAGYVWQIADDKINWTDNFKSLIGFKQGVELSSAREFETLLSSESAQTRFAALQDSLANLKGTQDSGVYQCVYAISTKHIMGDEPVWVEDTGRWYADENGQPDFAQGIVRVVSERRKREENLRRKSEIDDLTGLPNRQYFQQLMDRKINDGLALGQSSAFLLVSIADFDRINSLLGFNAGDEVLVQVADILRNTKRDKDIIARFSGAKFGFIFNKCNEQEVRIAANRMLHSLNATVLKTSGGPVSLKVSAGACIIPQQATSSHEAISAVTNALDQARSVFGPKIVVHSPEPEKALKRSKNTALLTRLVNVVETGAFHLAFQPVVGSQSHKPAFYEALLRMAPDAEVAIDDAAFLEIAEDLGLMRSLDFEALRQVLDVLETCPDANLSINVTHDSIANGDWFSELEKRIAAVPDIGPRLIVELTESQMVSNVSATRDAITAIKGLGCRVAIDDFGTGYTSFSQLRDLQPDIIKIDGSFCRELKSTPKNAEFLKSMQNLASQFDAETVVEWVEDAETATQLKDWGYTYMQGSLFGMPLSVLSWEQTRELHRELVSKRAS